MFGTKSIPFVGKHRHLMMRCKYQNQCIDAKRKANLLFRSESRRGMCAKLRTVAAIETTRRDHSVIACSRHVYMDVILSSLPVCGESRIQHRTYYAAVTAVNEYHQQNWVDRSGN